MDSLYTDILLDLYHHPLNKQPLRDFDVHHKETNPLCGDEIEIFVKLDKDGRVAEVGWQGEGCAISQAAASMTTEQIKEKKKQEIMKLKNEEILKMLGLENLNPTRMRCALLSLECLKQLNNKTIGQ